MHSGIADTAYVPQGTEFTDTRNAAWQRETLGQKTVYIVERHYSLEPAQSQEDLLFPNLLKNHSITTPPPLRWCYTRILTILPRCFKHRIAGQTAVRLAPPRQAKVNSGDTMSYRGLSSICHKQLRLNSQPRPSTQLTDGQARAATPSPPPAVEPSPAGASESR